MTHMGALYKRFICVYSTDVVKAKKRGSIWTGWLVVS